MFNVSKKTLSVVLCLALLLSVVAVCFMTPATAKTVTSTEAINTYADLSKELTPNVSLTFEEGSYGLPFGRYHSAVYNDGYAEVANNNGWVYVGNEASKSVSTTLQQDGSTANDEYVATNLLLFEAGKSYAVTVDYNFLAGATITDRTILFRLAANPNTGAGNDNLYSSKSFSGNTVEWKVDGVAQTGTLTADTDMQTATAIFTVKTSGYLGILNFVENDSEDNPIPATMAIDSVKVYNLTEQWDSTFQNKITFEDNAGGIGASRYNDASGYATEANGNRYGVLDINQNGSVYLASTEYSTYNSTVYGGSINATTAETANAIYKQLFKFLPDKTYEVSFKYRYPVGSGVTTGTALQFKLMADPLGQAHSADNLTASGTTWAKDVIFEGNTLTSALGVWQECKVTFTVKNATDAGYANVRPAVNDGYAFDGAYFGFTNLSTAVTLHVDDYEVKEITDSTSVTVESDVVYHDMENDSVGTSSSTTIGTNNTSTVTIVDSGEEKYGKVIQIATGGNYRFGSMDGQVFEEGKKYYISFDAKSTSGSGTISWITLGDYAGNNSNGVRVGIATESSVYSVMTNCWYVNGVNVGTFSKFTVEENVWKHYGFVLDLTDATVVAAIKAKNANVFNYAKNISIGRPGTLFDNFRIVSTHGVDGAVPDTTNDIIYGVSNKYTNDFTGMTTDDILVTDATQIAFEDAADGTEHGTVAKMSSTAKVRFSPKDSQIMTSGNKYTISFDAKLSEGESSSIWMGVANGESGGGKPRYIFNDSTGASTNGKGKQAFKLYIDGVETTYSNFKMDTTWRTYTIAFDFADEEFLTDFSNLVDVACNFHIGCANGMFDNFSIVERSLGDSEVSYRQAHVNGETYRSAGLRFKATIPTATVEAAEEIGFVAAPSTQASMTENWYKLENGLNKIARKGVVKDATKNYAYATDGAFTDYQMVITGLSAKVGEDLEGKTAFNRRFSVVLYTKIDGVYSYYALGEASYYQILGISETLRAQ